MKAFVRGALRSATVGLLLAGGVPWDGAALHGSFVSEAEARVETVPGLTANVLNSGKCAEGS